VDGLQQSVNLIDGLRGGDSAVAQLTIAFTGTSFDMDKFPDRTAHNGVTNGDLCLYPIEEEEEEDLFRETQYNKVK